MEWITEDRKRKARKANLIRFLKSEHPYLIHEKSDGQYVYSKRTCVAIFKGADGLYHYCDHDLRNRDEADYSGDAIKFLMKYVNGYDFTKAVESLCEFEDRDTEK